VNLPDIWPESEHQIPPPTDTKGEGPAATTSAAKVARPPLKPEEIPRGDAKKLREAVAREARLGEEALRRLQRASKLAKQSELWATAERDPVRKTKMGLWQDAMRELMGEEGAGAGGGQDVDMLDGGFGHDGVLQGRVGIADRSMVVNAEIGLRQLSKA
jgi:transcription initiation factor TFIID subunit 8